MHLRVNIHKAYRGFTLDVAFEHNEGVLGVLGASGTGKSMTLQCIAGIIKPDSGHISLDGRILYDSEKGIDLKPRERRVGYLFQNYALFPHMTVIENIGMGMGLSRRQARQDPRISELLTRLKLDGLAARYPAQISGGQQQRVALARILAYQPQLILLDEPFSALDTYLQEQMYLQLQELLSDWGGEAIMVTHNRDEAYTLCQRLLVLESGRVLGIGGKEDMFANPGKSGVARLTGCKNISRAQRVGEYSLRALDWNLQLISKRPLPENITGCGVRAHYMRPAEKSDANAFAICFHGMSDSPFERTFIVSCGGEESLWWKTSRDVEASRLPEYLSIPSEHLLLFTD